MAEKNLDEMREAVEAIREKMAAAAREAGRDPAETAAQLKKLMRNNVKTQYGEYNYKGLHLCAKSGTAEVDKDTDHNTAWFVGFMDDADYPYAFVVVVEHGGSGSQTAGPIAGSVLRTLVDKESK